MNKILFVDIDGTLTETISGHPFKQHPRDVSVMDGADKAIAYYGSQGWKIIGISNQGGIEKGFKSIQQTILEMRYTLSLIPQLQEIYFCPDFEGKQCYCINPSEEHAHDFGNLFPDYQGTFRKPSPGMIRLAMNFADNEITEIWMVGDRPEDEACAAAANINFCPADVWRNRFIRGMHEASITPEQLRFLENI